MEERLKFDREEQEELTPEKKQQRRYYRKKSDIRGNTSDINQRKPEEISDTIRHEPQENGNISDTEEEISDEIRREHSDRPWEYRKESDIENEVSDKNRYKKPDRLKNRPGKQEQLPEKETRLSEKPSEQKSPEAFSRSGQKRIKRKQAERLNGTTRTEAAQEKEPASRLKEVSSQAEKLTETGTESDVEAPVSEHLRSRQKKKGYEKAAPKKRRLRFDQKGSVPEQAIHGAGTAVGRTVAGETKADENVSVEATEKTAQGGSRTIRSVHQKLKTRKDRTHPGTPQTQTSSGRQEALRFHGQTEASEIRHEPGSQQRRWIRRNYAEGYRLVQRDGSSPVRGSAAPRPTLLNRIRNTVQSAPRKGKGALTVLGALGIFALIIISGIGAGGTMTTQAEGVVAATTYLAEDEEILAAEERYLELERLLQAQIDDIEVDYPGYDEYVYQIDEIGHNPYHLISYLTVLFGEFHYKDVATPIQGLFEQQYTMKLEEETEVVTETRTIRAGESLGSVVTSGYCPCEICCGKSDGITASGRQATANHTIAVDAQNPFVPMGTHVIMNGREYVVEDVGAFDRYGVQFDVYYDDHQMASAHGHQTWEARLADDNGEEVEITDTHEVRRLLIKVSNSSLDRVVRGLLDEEQLEEYMTYNSCYGNKEYLFGTENLPGEGGYGGIKYEIPPEALKDKQFKAMITEAEKYLGMAYKWGGKKPSDGFDCSGFVSWVINHCGVGWDFGSRGAEALCGLCTYVSPGEARPGDLVFFERTYDVDGVSHVGIYVGEHMMIHCGDPIQYTNLEYQYWKDHFLCFGRLPSP